MTVSDHPGLPIYHQLLDLRSSCITQLWVPSSNWQVCYRMAGVRSYVTCFSWHLLCSCQTLRRSIECFSVIHHPSIPFWPCWLEWEDTVLIPHKSLFTSTVEHTRILYSESSRVNRSDLANSAEYDAYINMRLSQFFVKRVRCTLHLCLPVLVWWWPAGVWTETAW